MLQLIQDDNGQFNLVFNATAMTDPNAAFSTLVYAALFTDAETTAAQMPNRYERRGWWFDATAGSLIWWYRQQALSPSVRAATIANIKSVLESYPALSAIDIQDITPLGNVSSLILTIGATYNTVKALVTIAL